MGFLQKAKKLNELLQVTDEATVGDIENERLIFSLDHMQELLEADDGESNIIYEAPLLEAVK